MTQKVGPAREAPRAARGSSDLADRAPNTVTPTQKQAIRAELIGSNLTWRRTANGWRLFAGKRCFGTIVPDRKSPGTWRSPMSGGRLSDMANLTWAKHAVLEAAIRELECERKGNHPRKCPENEGVSEPSAPPIAPMMEAAE
jgi:hypothetical protein